MLEIFSNNYHTSGNMIKPCLFASVLTIIIFCQHISAQSGYVDFLSKANDQLTVDLLSALAGMIYDKL